MCRRILRFALPIVSMAALATAALAQEGSGGAAVVVDAHRLNPASVRISAGEVVTFQVEADETLVEEMEPLILVADEGSFRSPPLEPGDRWRVSLQHTGIHRYHIEQHPSVEGAVIVE